jgi:hypothetical protein
MNDSAPKEIDHLIEVFTHLQQMAKDLDDPLCNRELIVGLILVLIKNTKIPNVTILPNIKEIALA